jgi:hypothetical protein
MNNIEMEEYDILPLGRNEALPVSLTRDGLPFSYPEAICLLKDLDANKLLEEFTSTRRKIPESLIAGREHLLYRGQDSKSVFKSLAEMGFSKGTYAAIAMRGPNQTELLEEIGPYTRQVMDLLGAQTFRQQYVIAEPGWKSAPHFDHYSFKVHGLRVHIPLTTPSFMAYPQDDERENIYELSPGEAWFINSGRQHYAFNPSSKTRINIQVQINSDSPILSSLGDVSGN